MMWGKEQVVYSHTKSLWNVVRFRRAGQESTGSESGQPVQSSRSDSPRPSACSAHSSERRGSLRTPGDGAAPFWMMVLRHKALLGVRQMVQRCAQRAAWTQVAPDDDGCRKCGVIRGRPTCRGAHEAP